MSIGNSGSLSLNSDPKFVIAQKQPWLFPLDINGASYDELLRVPGIGPISAKRIIVARREHSIFSLQQLKIIGVVVSRAKSYIWYRGINSEERQISFLPSIDETVFEDNKVSVTSPGL